MGEMTMRATAITGLLLATTLASCASNGEVHAQSPLSPGAEYVAMGSSYAAGSGIGQQKPGTPARCDRSALNYASLVAQRLGLALTDVSCGGATTAHILGPWSELPPQIDAVTANTRLVTVTIGGNDVSYVRNLFSANCKFAASANTGAPTRSCPSALPPTESDWVKLEANMRQIAQEVSRRAPKAKLIFVDYVTLLPEQGACPAAMLSIDDANAARATGQRLAAITAKVAREEHADLLAAGKLSHGHTPCDAEPWSVGAPGTAKGSPWHPNAAGMRAIADALVQRLD